MGFTVALYTYMGGALIIGLLPFHALPSHPASPHALQSYMMICVNGNLNRGYNVKYKKNSFQSINLISCK
jgi:hypothetical protein